MAEADWSNLLDAIARDGSDPRGGVAAAVVDAAAEVVDATPEWRELVGVAPGNAVFDAVHVDDLAALGELVQGRCGTITVRLLGAHPVRRTVELHPTMPTGLTEGTVLLVGVDVTDRIRDRAALAATQALLTEVLEPRPIGTALDGIARYAEQLAPDAGCAIFLNRDRDLELAAAPTMPAPWARAAQRIAGAVDEMLGTPADAFGALPAGLAELSHRRGARGGRGMALVDGDGRPIGLLAWFPKSLRFPHDTEADAIRMAARFAVIAIERDTARRAAVVDGDDRDRITGLLTRPAFVAAAEPLLCGPGALGVLLIHIENLAAINREYGDTAGDVVLSSVGERVARAARGRDIAGRLGGSTVAILGRIRAERGLDALAVRLDRELGAAIAACGHRIVPRVDLRIGVSSAGEMSLSELIERADRASAGVASDR